MSQKEPLIHPDAVAALRKLSEQGRDFYAEVALVYLQQVPAKVNELDSKLRERNFKAISSIAHQLKSSTANLGAMSLTELFVRLEESAKSKDLENLLRILPELNKTFSAVEAELRKLVSQSAKKAS